MRARRRLALDRQIEDWIASPDQLSEEATLRRASTLLTEMAKMDSGPRLERQRRELARLLKRAATPLEVEFVSDGAQGQRYEELAGRIEQTGASIEPGQLPHVRGDLDRPPRRRRTRALLPLGPGPEPTSSTWSPNPTGSQPRIASSCI